MSGNDRPELAAFRELETLVRHLGEELAAFRRRAIAAEAQLKDAGHAPKGRSPASSGRVADLEAENEVLRTRLDRSEDRVRQVMERVRFLRQQLQSQAPAGAARS
jgi:predicted  nucleic acid-binding Zn-ribbon protein